MRIIEDLFNVIAPHECLVCKKEGELICGECVSRLIATPARCYKCRRWSDGFRTCDRCRSSSPLYGVWSVTSYDSTAKELVHVLKFARAKAGAVTMARAMAAVCELSEDVVVTHVPTANIRIRERGYDQAALIARELSRIASRPHVSLLARNGSLRQLGQRREERKKQMEGMFRTLGGVDVRGKHILLVDDVFTTGATCEASARVLREAGARRVSAVVFAVA